MKLHNDGLKMKNRKRPIGQYKLEGMGEIDENEDYVQEIIPLIGEVVLLFNGLESDLDSYLCEIISDRSDSNGLIVLNHMMYSTKVSLYERFVNERNNNIPDVFPDHKSVITSLKECGTLRNRIVHANWEHTDVDGYTHVRFTMGKEGMQHELVQFSVESMYKTLSKILDTRKLCGEYEEEASYAFSSIDSLSD